MTLIAILYTQICNNASNAHNRRMISPKGGLGFQLATSICRFEIM